MRAIIEGIKDVVIGKAPDSKPISIMCDLGAYELIRRHASEELLLDESSKVDFFSSFPSRAINEEFYRNMLLSEQIDTSEIEQWHLLLEGELIILVNGVSRYEYNAGEMLLASKLYTLFNLLNGHIGSCTTRVVYDTKHHELLSGAICRLIGLGRDIVPCGEPSIEVLRREPNERMVCDCIYCGNGRFYRFVPAKADQIVNKKYTEPYIELYIDETNHRNVYAILKDISGNRRTSEVFYPL